MLVCLRDINLAMIRNNTLVLPPKLTANERIDDRELQEFSAENPIPRH
jgi:hypothetical protein